jgi:ubiquinone/menaquinone biosynthesis C-methylase UbiE
MTQAVFDPIKFKNTTRQQWDAAAEAWDRWSPLLSRWLGPATELMLDMTGVKAGSRVLDVAAGAGEQTLTAARRVGPKGYVLATDLSAGILERAARNAELSGFGNVETAVVDGEALGEINAEPFDAVISRVGLIYFPDLAPDAGRSFRLRAR